MNEQFIQNLKRLRRAKHLSQDRLAKTLKLSRSTITKYERGEREPDFKTLEMLSDFFDVSVDFLLGRAPEDYLTKKSDAEKQPTLAVKESLAPDYLVDPFNVEVLKVLTGDGVLLNVEEQQFLLKMIQVYLATVAAEKQAKPS